MRNLLECTFADLLDPAGFGGSDERVELIRDSVIFGLHRIDGVEGTLIAVNRDYRPVGSDLPHDAPHDLDFREFTEAHFSLDELVLDGADRDPTRPGLAWLTPTQAGFFLWCDNSAPYRSPATLARYRVALIDVVGPEGVARLATLNGRNLGAFPNRAAAWEELLALLEAAEDCED
jgi:hypothetical protein